MEVPFKKTLATGYPLASKLAVSCTFSTCGNNTLGELAKGPLTAILFEYLIRGKLFYKAEKNNCLVLLNFLGEALIQVIYKHIQKLFMTNIVDTSLS